MKSISEELDSDRCCGHTGEKPQLVELAKQWEDYCHSLEQRVKELEDKLWKL